MRTKHIGSGKACLAGGRNMPCMLYVGGVGRCCSRGGARASTRQGQWQRNSSSSAGVGSTHSLVAAQRAHTYGSVHAADPFVGCLPSMLQTTGVGQCQQHPAGQRRHEDDHYLQSRGGAAQHTAGVHLAQPVSQPYLKWQHCETLAHGRLGVCFPAQVAQVAAGGGSGGHILACSSMPRRA